jgi:hypothetical protein
MVVRGKIVNLVGFLEVWGIGPFKMTTQAKDGRYALFNKKIYEKFKNYDSSHYNYFFDF